MKRLRRLGLTLGTLAWTSWAHADLGADVRALMAARVGHARVVRLKPRLLERGDLLPLPIPPALLDPKDSTCTTVSLLGVVGLHFVVRFAGSARSAATALRPEPSAAGAHEVTRCGESKPLLAGLLLEMRSPRGVIETLVTNAPGAVPRLAETLDGRDPGLELPLGDPGARPALPPLRMRVDRLRARAKQAAVASFELDRLQAGPEGSGARALFLEAGCHELSLLAESGPDLDTDLDLELVDSESEAVLGLDRSDDTDASLSVCVGARTRAELRFVGARERFARVVPRSVGDTCQFAPSLGGRAAFTTRAAGAGTPPEFAGPAHLRIGRRAGHDGAARGGRAGRLLQRALGADPRRCAGFVLVGSGGRARRSAAG